MNKLLDKFESDLSSWLNDLTYVVEEIKFFAPKSSNGEIEECSYLKVKQAQLEVLRSIHLSFKNVLEQLKNESEE